MNPYIINFLIKCSESYYNTGEYYTPSQEDIDELAKDEFFINEDEITDYIYDTLYDKAKNKYAYLPFFGMVGAESYGDDIEFKNPAGSMTELKEGDWDKWRDADLSYVISEKLDGLSVVLFYKNGSLYKAATRGDGYKGKDILRHILHISNIPKTISFMPGEVEIRGELICPRNQIKSMIDDLKEETGKEYKNGRNTISGFLNSKKTLLSVAKYAKFNAFDGDFIYNDELDKFTTLMELGFDVPKYHEVSGCITEEQLLNTVNAVRNNSVYECDGIIITVNKPSAKYAGYDTGTINPKKSRKFKLGATNNIATTKIKDIKWQTSRYGVLTPVVEIEPVQLCGVTIYRATGHNYKNIIENHMGVGSKIEICRSGDVIPYIKRVIETEGEIPLPNVDTIIDGVDLKLKDISTPSVFVYEMKIQQLVFFCQSLGIDNIGAGNLECLMRWFDERNDAYMEWSDFLTISKQVMFNEIGVNGEKIYDSLKAIKETASEVDWMVAACAFGQGMGKSVLQSVFDKYYTLDVTEAQLRMISGFGDTRIKQYIENIENYHRIKGLLEDLNIVFAKIERTVLSEKYASYIVCFTGVRDAELSKTIRENGGIATDSWNKNVNLLVAKDPNGNSGKIKKAHEKGIQVVSLDEARQMFN